MRTDSLFFVAACPSKSLSVYREERGCWVAPYTLERVLCGVYVVSLVLCLREYFDGCGLQEYGGFVGHWTLDGTLRFYGEYVLFCTGCNKTRAKQKTGILGIKI